MAAIYSQLTASSTNYEPLSRFYHVSGRSSCKVLVQGGITKDFSEGSREFLSSVVETYDPYSELWEQRYVKGNPPSPGTYWSASSSLRDELFSFGGWDRRHYFNSLHCLDTKTWCWSEVSPQNADGAPMPKWGCGMIALRNSLVVFGGYGIPQQPTESQSFIINSKFPDGRGWSNKIHIYNISEGRESIGKYKFNLI